MNPIMLIDGYKLDHRRQYPEGTTGVYSNWTPRESRMPGVDKVVHFGLQAFLDDFAADMDRRFFSQNARIVCQRYEKRVNGYLGPNAIGTEHISALHSLGYLPLEFRGLPEGTHVPIGVPMFTVENTHPDFFWLVNYIESLMSSELWLPCTSATKAVRLRRLLDAAAARTGTDPAFVPWQGHDFSFRGMPGAHAAAMSGAGHLLAFTGTDTLPALDWIEHHYGPLPEGYLLAGSVPATEHSVMCAGGSATLNEAATFSRMLELYPSGIVSVVSDTWNLWKVLTTILPQLKEQILARPGKLVIRPDSGDPVKILCGDPEETGAARKGVVQLLWDFFGGSMNKKGFLELDPHIGCIYGDAITYETADKITRRLEEQRFASGNVVFGIGSYTYQGNTTRDTFGFAMKATWAKINGEPHALYKDPVTGRSKRSAKGRLAVRMEENGLMLFNNATKEEEAVSLLRPVWRNGRFVHSDTFDVIRERALEG